MVEKEEQPTESHDGGVGGGAKQGKKKKMSVLQKTLSGLAGIGVVGIVGLVTDLMGLHSQVCEIGKQTRTHFVVDFFCGVGEKPLVQVDPFWGGSVEAGQSFEVTANLEGVLANHDEYFISYYTENGDAVAEQHYMPTDGTYYFVRDQESILIETIEPIDKARSFKLILAHPEPARFAYDPDSPSKYTLKVTISPRNETAAPPVSGPGTVFHTAPINPRSGAVLQSVPPSQKAARSMEEMHLVDLAANDTCQKSARRYGTRDDNLDYQIEVTSTGSNAFTLKGDGPPSGIGVVVCFIPGAPAGAAEIGWDRVESDWGQPDGEGGGFYVARFDSERMLGRRVTSTSDLSSEELSLVQSLLLNENNLVHRKSAGQRVEIQDIGLRGWREGRYDLVVVGFVDPWSGENGAAPTHEIKGLYLLTRATAKNR